ncbi:YslB family protein [Halalkalibacter alkalisediminis]|uniref:YslB family protein n=1 Tax=Halalkalibacter alkalisediminis TaxID=935616 RepID=A0ABV6NAR6_9BACI|nr:YslB family protein [Halalkalibacter alkalisediminis]
MERQIKQFGYDLIRNDVLKEVLGKEHDTLLYWIGKSLARKYPVATIEELISFFEDANWGTLNHIKEKKQVQTFELSGPWITKQDTRCYQLEAGFLSQQLETWHNCITGTTYSVKKEAIHFTVELDRKDLVN